MTKQSAASNHLANETSPYLRQHAQNPVDWHPWGPEALDKARKLDRPIFLSIGYSACHWCHVMEHESFEDGEIAGLLNQHFVSIKVDREERPDLDQIYMTAVQMLTGQGGWPMSMFLTPELKPFFGGTYFPPDDRYGRPGFKRVLLSLIDAWRTRREEIKQSSEQITEQLQIAASGLTLTSDAGERQAASGGDLQPGLIRNAVSGLQRVFDSSQGGFGSAPKFPHPMDLRLLLRAWNRFDDEDALNMARLTLDRMAMGGIYDHLGGGFARYSTDERWLVPHFEKMLYDNALLTLCYLEAFQATHEPFYRQVVEETLGWVLREMTSLEGPFYSTLDADSEGVEGKFYVWSAAEVEQVLGKEAADVFTYVYDITPEGNWEAHNILHRVKSYHQDARLLNVDETELRRMLDDGKRKLFAVREHRIRPGRDEKILTSWNGLMIAAFAAAAQTLDNSIYAAAAAKAADFILRHMRTADGRLLRTYSHGSAAKLNAYLEDYGFLLDALVSVYETTFEIRWIEEAVRLADVMIEQFWDAKEAGFFYTGKDHEKLISRTKEVQDNAIPSGNAMAVTALLRLGKLTGRADYLDKAEATLRLYHGLMAKHPMACGQLLNALDFWVGPVDEFAVVGETQSAATQRVLRAIHADFHPNHVLALLSSPAPSTKEAQLLPLLAAKESLGDVTTYICRNYACQKPLVGAESLERELKAGLKIMPENEK